MGNNPRSIIQFKVLGIYLKMPGYIHLCEQKALSARTRKHNLLFTLKHVFRVFHTQHVAAEHLRVSRGRWCPDKTLYMYESAFSKLNVRHSAWKDFPSKSATKHSCTKDTVRLEFRAWQVIFVCRPRFARDLSFSDTLVAELYLSFTGPFTCNFCWPSATGPGASQVLYVGHDSLHAILIPFVGNFSSMLYQPIFSVFCAAVSFTCHPGYQREAVRRWAPPAGLEVLSSSLMHASPWVCVPVDTPMVIYVNNN